MSDLKHDDPAIGNRKAPPNADATSTEREKTSLQSALEKWDRYFTPEEQAALRAYESEQGTVE